MSCTRPDGKPKAAYESFDDAMDAVMRCARNGAVPYKCPHGHGWHVASKLSRRMRQAMQARPPRWDR